MINIMTEVIKNKKKMCHLALFISISPTHKMAIDFLSDKAFCSVSIRTGNCTVDREFKSR